MLSNIYRVTARSYFGRVMFKIPRLNNTSDAFSNLCTFTQGWSGAKEPRGLSGPKPGPLLPTARRDGISRSLVAGWFTANYHMRGNI